MLHLQLSVSVVEFQQVKASLVNVNDIVLVFLLFSSEHISHLFLSVSVVDFEEVNASWVLTH